MPNAIDKVKSIIKDAAKKLTSHKRREFEAEVAIELSDGNARKVEREFGQGRETIEKGIRELTGGIRCVDNYQGRGDKKTEEKTPDSEQDIKEIAEPHSLVDPKFQGDLIYTRTTAKSVRMALIDYKGYQDEDLPGERTVLNILNRLNYTLKRVQKSKPLKKGKNVDEIFENVHQANKESDNNPESLRISIDTKAEVKISELSRGGKSRCDEALKAHDHDTEWSAKLKPVGILDVVAGFVTITFANSVETSDFIVDALTIWWETNKLIYINIKELVINLDNGPHNSSRRTQFIKRIIEFSDRSGLCIHQVYYPPYHS